MEGYQVRLKTGASSPLSFLLSSPPPALLLQAGRLGRGKGLDASAVGKTTLIFNVESGFINNTKEMHFA